MKTEKRWWEYYQAGTVISFRLYCFQQMQDEEPEDLMGDHMGRNY